MLAGVLALVGAVAGIYYYNMRPELLQVAVGPSNSDDAKVVQGLVQAFARSHKQIRLHPLLTDGVAASAKALSDGEERIRLLGTDRLGDFGGGELDDVNLGWIDVVLPKDHFQQIDIGLGDADDADAMAGELRNVLDRCGLALATDVFTLRLRWNP